MRFDKVQASPFRNLVAFIESPGNISTTMNGELRFVRLVESRSDDSGRLYTFTLEVQTECVERRGGDGKYDSKNIGREELNQLFDALKLFPV
jgi:hypothetical protein